MGRLAPIQPHDATWMARAIELSKRGLPAPNPHVGCVIINGDRIVGEGFHDHAGGPHAEAVALAESAGDAKGSTAYVTLEPCNHHGRTPPCSEALVRAGIQRVVFAVADPNPSATGGSEFLQKNGVSVTQGVSAQEAAWVNRQFLTSHKLGRPYVTVKSAITLDGFLAKPNGESKWITSELARQDAHRLRAERGCVLVGRGTVVADNPQLTARDVGAVNQPVRCVLDPEGKIPPESNVFDHQADLVWLVRDPRKESQTIWPEGSVAGALNVLFGRGIRGVLVEGGATTIGKFLESGLIDEVVLYVASKTFGNGLPWTGQASVSLDELELKLIEVSQIGPDAKLVYGIERDLGT